MDKDEIRYAIAKQTASMEYIHTAYGDLELDIGLKEAVREAVERVLYKRLGERPIIDTLTVELAPTQRDGLDEMVGLTGASDDSLAQLIFDHGFEAWDSLARLIQKK